MRRHDFKWDEGSLSAEEREALIAILFKGDMVSSRPIIELGTLIGKTTQILQGWQDDFEQIVPVITVDCYRWNPWGLTPDSQHALALAMLFPCIADQHVKVVRERKEEFCKRFDGSPSLVFIDADHSYKSVRADIAWARSVGAAIICGHDYYADGSKHPGVKQAVDEAGGPKELVGSLWVI